MYLNALSPAQKWLVAAAASAVLAIAPTSLTAQDDIPNAARLGFVAGNVSIEPAGVDTWGQAYPNLPIGPGDRIFTDDSGRAEIQVGQTYVRIGPNTDVTLTNENPYSIAFGLAQGSIHVHVLGLWPQQALQVHTPNANITTTDPDREFRVDTAPDQSNSIFTSFRQPVVVTGVGGYEQPIAGDQTLQINGVNPPYPQWLQPNDPDDLDRWSMDRDRQIVNAAAYRYVSPYIPGAAELDASGDWQPNTPYGAVWFPRGVDGGWAPYRNGHWVNHAPWGWMWVEDEPWGYAPFHYGRWVSLGGRWGWVPGPPSARPVFAPALVAFAGGVQFGGVGVSVWFPLGPGEAYRPPYPCRPEYIDRVNITNITQTNVVHVQKTYVNIVNVTNVTYVNRTSGVTAMNQNDFASGRRAAQSQVKVDPQQLARATVIERPEPEPVAASFVGRPPARPIMVKADRPVLLNSDGKLAAAKPGAKPVDAPVKAVVAPRPVPGRTVVAPPAGAKPAPVQAGRPGQQPAATQPVPPPARPTAQPITPAGRPTPPAKPEDKPVPPAVRPEPKPTEPASKPTPPPARPDNRPTTPPDRPDNKPTSRPARPDARPTTPPDRPDARPTPPPARPDARPTPPPDRPDTHPATPPQKPAAKPAPKPEDKNKKPDDKDKKPE